MSENGKKTNVYIRYFLIRFALAAFDILAVNAAYFCALLVRYYVAFEFNEWAVPYVNSLIKFAPFYTVSCLVVFWIFKLYNSRWKYASLNDMNRILAANLITCIIHVAGSVIFVMRMPLSYYVLGAVIQFVLIAGSRFSYRILNIERIHVRKLRNTTSINVMIVGAGESSRIVLKHLERDTDSAARPVCMIDLHGDEYGSLVAGIPVVCGADKMASSIRKYGVECVILADSIMPYDTRKEIKGICKDMGIEVQDFTGYFQNSRGTVSLRNLLEYSKGAVELVINGKSHRFVNGEQALMSVTGKYMIHSVYAKEDYLVIELSKDILVPNDVHEEWIKSYEKETGEDISFF